MLKNILKTLSQQGSSRFYIAFSGGLDSTVLLHLLATSSLKNKLQAIHVNHHLSSNANQWQEHCERLCEQFGVPLIAESVNVTGRDGIEANARRVRYEVFEETIQSGECLLTAHHQDDQIETLLYRLFRGAGPEGLAGMPEERALGDGVLVRPLLGVTRGELESYAHANALQWIDDESNESTQYDRNFIRHELIPLIEERWPGSGNCVARAAKLCRDQAVLNEQIGHELIGRLQLQIEKLGSSIAGETLEQLSPEQQSLVLRYWYKNQTGTVPEAKQLALILPEVWRAYDDAKPCLKMGSYEVRRFQKRLHLIPVLNVTDESFSVIWHCDANGENSLELPDDSQLRLPESTVFSESFELHVNYHRKGVRCKPCGRNHSQTLKKLFQENGVAPWLRDRMPLIYLEGVLIAVGDLWLTEDALGLEPFRHSERNHHFFWTLPNTPSL